MDGNPVYPGSIHGVSMWRYPDRGSTFGSVHGRRGLVGCPLRSRIPRQLRVGRASELTAVQKKKKNKPPLYH